jgi:hypothetical protein
MQRIAPLLIAFLLSFCTYTAISQTPFFVSKQEFTEDELKVFYSSVTIAGNRVFFVANDYKLYAYEKTSAEPIWCRSLEIKSNTPCYVAGGSVYAPYIEAKVKSTVRIDSATGKIIKILPVETLQTTPQLKDGILYGTAIYGGGTIFAYDTKADSILWSKFVAHGVSTQPYYFPDYIQANAESDNWVRISYSGQYIDTTCKEKADIFVQDIPCIKNFNALTHDGHELNERFLEKIFGDNSNSITAENVSRGQHNSFILYDGKLVILGDKRKVVVELDLPDLLADTIEVDYDSPTRVLGSNETIVSFLYNNRMFSYDHKKKRIERMTDLSSWNPSQALLDDKRLWLISKKDGKLYGLFP